VYAARRAATLARLDALSAAGWARTGRHAVYGVLDVAAMLRILSTRQEPARSRATHSGRRGIRSSGGWRVGQQCLPAPAAAAKRRQTKARDELPRTARSSRPRRDRTGREERRVAVSAA
jgi:hypothetical protein